MTADNDLLALHSHASSDRRFLIASLAGAALLHLAALLISLPERKATFEPPPKPEPINLQPVTREPPELPEPESVEPPPPSERLTPIPMPEDPSQEPVHEEIPAPPVFEPYEPGPTATLDYEPVPPPPLPPSVLDEGTEGLVLPVPIGERTEPGYPAAARHKRLHGRVVLSAVIDVDGAVESIEVVHVSRPGLGFSQAAIDAVSTWRYEPGRYRGRPVAVRMRVLVEFTMQ